QGYFSDAFIQHFVCKVGRRAPLINRGYYVRWKAVDHYPVDEMPPRPHSDSVWLSCPLLLQVLSLGAGFDSLYFRLHADGVLDGAVVFEVDFPDVARRKAALIGADAALRGMLDSCLPPQAGSSSHFFASACLDIVSFIPRDHRMHN
uniref:Uncharacterized protein n=1 Tax=Cyprinodon variegatus TaxID=28743 RepID=A0A3Q2DE97_CYPVA